LDIRLRFCVQIIIYYLINTTHGYCGASGAVQYNIGQDDPRNNNNTRAAEFVMCIRASAPELIKTCLWSKTPKLDLFQSELSRHNATCARGDGNRVAYTYIVREDRRDRVTRLVNVKLNNIFFRHPSSVICNAPCRLVCTVDTSFL